MGYAGAPGIQGAEKTPWQRSGSGRRRLSVPRAFPVPAQEKNCFLRGKTPREQISAKVREGYVLAPRAAAATELPSAETARRKRRPKLTRSSRQSPPRSRTRVPWQCPLPLPSPRRGQIGEFEIWKGEGGGRIPETEGRSRESPRLVPHPPLETASGATPHLRGCSRSRLPSRGHCSAPPRGGSPRGELGLRQSPQALGYPLS